MADHTIKPGNLMISVSSLGLSEVQPHIEFVLSVDPAYKERPTFAIVLQDNKIVLQKEPGLYWSSYWIKHE